MTKPKKITAKRKAAPSPVVVLESWIGATSDPCRIMYDARDDRIHYQHVVDLTWIDCNWEKFCIGECPYLAEMPV